MFLPENSGDFAEFTSPHFSTREPKPHQPADAIGKRYVKYFWHPFRAIIAPVRNVDTKPAWRTIDYYLHPSQLWKLHQDKSKLVGLRFDNTTRYATIDLDIFGDYHNLESINRIKAALEDIGIVDLIILQSSFSGGYHLLIPLDAELPTFALACALEITLRNAGFIICQGHLEIFPNAKAYSEKEITNYNAIRCPMQPGSGSLLLDDDLQPISSDVSTFLDHCDRAAVRQDLQLLKRVAQKARRKITRERYRNRETVKGKKWRADMSEIIATGWTGSGQTNTLLQIITGYGIVFLDLEGEALVKYAVETATSAPGYTQYCRHQHEIEARVRQWVECTIRHKWYTPYASYPSRLLGTFANTYAEVIAQGRNIKPKDNIIPLDGRVARNFERSQIAQRRIKWVVSGLEWDSRLPNGITSRAELISLEYKSRFNKTLSQETLRKHLHLWHPKWYIEDPWLENSSNLSQISKDGQFDQKSNPEKNQTVQNTSQIDKYGHLSYMKVLCLPQSVVKPTDQEDSPLPLVFLTPLNSEQSLQRESEQQFDKYSKYVFSSGAAKNCDKPDLSMNDSDVVDAATTTAALLPTPYDVAEPEPTNSNALTSQVEELRRTTRLRLQAIAHAKHLVNTYCAITGKFKGGTERSSLEEIAKMQFYLNSGCNSLIAEAQAWAAANPGCLPFTLESGHTL